MPTPRQPRLAARLQGFGTTIFTEMTRYAQAHGALNLGQGFPDFDGPDFVKEAAIRAIREGHNQYAPMPGRPELAAAVAEHQRRFYGLELDPVSQITITHGATEAIHATLQALCDVGDEVIVFEPFYDSYRACIAMAGAVDRLYTLEDPGFAVESDRLSDLVSAKTRAILLNSPHNPTGKVFRRHELEAIAELAREHDLVVISDEVYEHLVFEGEHLPIAVLPGMAERTVTISSAGKTFSFTGWKVGWACASPELTSAIRTAHQFVTFSVGSPFQPAIQEALGASDRVYDELLESYRERRDLLCGGLEAAGFAVRVPAGTYFALADIRPLGFTDDVDFCRRLPQLVKVAAIPPTAFYVNKSAGRHLVRFAFCKSRDVLEEGIRRLQDLRVRAG
ncbi:MAG: aminotransferase class I/II-fold pyridoxal phosphate-dependent enzyme [Holophagales bacterium]|nr:aminotransferase class I/II-fold pyridoxal phosphate-dependent enzyme [Holophagales bacterium]